MADFAKKLTDAVMEAARTQSLLAQAQAAEKAAAEAYAKAADSVRDAHRELTSWTNTVVHVGGDSKSLKA